ncbi:MAG: NAD(P)H-dependent oxidoreductase subunit E [Acidobacteriota bacterium]
MSTPFQFSDENQDRFAVIISRYPHKRAAMLPTLHLIQEQQGYISPEAEEYAAQKLDLPEVEVREVVSFYSMFSTEPRGRHHIKVCSSLSCWVCGSSGIREHLRGRLGVEPGETTSDGEISWEVVPDCLGACELAPMIQLDGMNKGLLTPEKLDALLGEISQVFQSREKGDQK